VRVGSRARVTRALAVLVLAVALAACSSLAGPGCRPQLAGGGTGADTGSGSGGVTPGSGGIGGTGGTGGTGGQTPPPADTAFCPLCGVEEPRAALLHRPLAVCVDNQSAARPQSGLKDACLVYEVLTEGGITRFLAFYLHEKATAVGPIRSLRPYLLDLSMALGAPIAFVGGSQAALDDVATLKASARAINEMSYPYPFWRSEARSSPHNSYAGIAELRSASAALGYEPATLSNPTVPAFSFAPTPDKAVLPTGQTVQRFTLTYAAGAGDYSVTYDFDPEAGQWMRYLGRSAQVDAVDGHQLRATTVIVQFVSSSVIPGDSEGRLKLNLTGGGSCRVFCQGRTFTASWAKSGRTSGLTYTDASGKPLNLPPGPVWVLIAPPNSAVTTQ